MDDVDKADQFLFSQLVVPGTVNMSAHRPRTRVRKMLKARMHGDHPSLISSVVGGGSNADDRDDDDSDDPDSDSAGDADNALDGWHASNPALAPVVEEITRRSGPSGPSSGLGRSGLHASSGVVPDSGSISGSLTDSDEDRRLSSRQRTGRPMAGSGWDVANRFRPNTNVAVPAQKSLHGQHAIHATTPTPRSSPNSHGNESDCNGNGNDNDNGNHNHNVHVHDNIYDNDEDEYENNEDKQYVMQQRYGESGSVRMGTDILPHQPRPNTQALITDPSMPAPLRKDMCANDDETPLQKTIRECMQPPPAPTPFYAYDNPHGQRQRQGHGYGDQSGAHGHERGHGRGHRHGHGHGRYSAVSTACSRTASSFTGSYITDDDADGGASAVESSVSHPYARHGGKSRRDIVKSGPGSHTQSHVHHRRHRRDDTSSYGRRKRNTRRGRDDRADRADRDDSDFEEVDVANKRELIAELDKLALGGAVLAFKPTMDHSASELRHELERRLANTTLIQRVAFIKGIVKIIALVLELVLSTFMRVKNWSVFITENLDTGNYDQSLEQIYRSLWKRGAPSPWLNLGLLVVGSLLGFHFLGMQPSTVPAASAAAVAGATTAPPATAGKSLSAGIGGLVSGLMSGGGLGGIMSGVMSGVSGANMPTRAAFSAAPVARPPSPPPVKPQTSASAATSAGTGVRSRPRISAPMP